MVRHDDAAAFGWYVVDAFDRGTKVSLVQELDGRLDAALKARVEAEVVEVLRTTAQRGAPPLARNEVLRRRLRGVDSCWLRGAGFCQRADAALRARRRDFDFGFGVARGVAEISLTYQAVEARFERADLRFYVAGPTLLRGGRAAVEGPAVLRGWGDHARANAQLERLVRIYIRIAEPHFLDGGTLVDGRLGLRRGRRRG